MAPLPPVEPPPLSMTSIPTNARPTPAEPVKPPVLASEMLREEVAPMAPGQIMLRVWLGTFAVAFALAALTYSLGYGPHYRGVFAGSLATAVVATFSAIVPVPYAARASLAGVVGLVPLLMGLTGDGPLAAIGFEGFLHAGSGLFIVTVLPGALFFRARYRAFAAAKVILGVTLAFSLVAVIQLAGGALDATSPPLARAADGMVLLSILTAFFGFMGEETGGGCHAWAILIVGVHAARLGAQTLVGGLETERFGRWGFAVGGVGEFFASTLVAYAIFQLLAVLFAREARKVDVHRLVGPSADRRRGSLSSE